MAPARAAAYFGGAVLMAAWLSSTAGVSPLPRTEPVPRANADDPVMAALAADVQAQAARLRQRLATAPAPNTPIRNPFNFAERDAQAGKAGARMEARPPTAGAAPAVPDLELVLLGIAEENTPAGLVRTAMIAGREDELFLVTEGQQLAGRYSVGAVSADAVELKDLATGAIRRLALKSPVSPL